MATPTDTDSGRWSPAWGVSLAAHLMLVGSVVVLGGGEAGVLPSDGDREIGVVVRRSDAEAAEPEQPVERPSEAAEAAPTFDVSAITPAEGPSPLIADLLAELTAAPAEQPAAGDAEQPTTGGARSPLPYGHTRASVFGLEATGGRFVYAFDRSMSMRGAPLRAAKRQLIESLGALRDVHKFQILFFNHTVSAFDLTGGRRRVAFGTDANKRRAVDYVSGITADGNTLRLPALRHALDLRPDAVFFLTDAEDPLSSREMEIVERMAGTATINTIEFGVGRKTSRSNFLMALAEATGGGYVYVDTQKLGR